VRLGGRPPGQPRSPNLNRARTHLRLDAKRAAEQAKRYRYGARVAKNPEKQATMEQLAVAYQYVADYLSDFLEKRFM